MDTDFTVGIGSSKSSIEYDVYAKGHLEPRPKKIENDDSVEGGYHAIGQVSKGYWDAFNVRGFIGAINAPPEAQFKLNGKIVSREQVLNYRPSRLAGSSTSDQTTSSGERHDLLLSSNNGADYELLLKTGQLSPKSGVGNGALTHNGRGAKAHLDANDAHAYTVEGKPTFATVDFDGSLMAALDGESVSGADLRSGQPTETATRATEIPSGTSGNGGGPDSAPPSKTSQKASKNVGQNRTGGTGGDLADGNVITPSNVQEQLNQIAGRAGDAPGHERKSFARLEPNATFDFGETIHIPRNMHVEAAGASIVPSSSYDLFTLDLGSVLSNAYVNLRGFDGTYDARVVTVDPANITYGANQSERDAGYVDASAMVPNRKFRFVEHERQNFFANGTGVRGMTVLAQPRDDSTLFYLTQNQTVSGWQCSCLAMFTLEASARDVAYPVDINSRGSKGFINSVTVKGEAAGWKQGITIRGEETARKNRFMMNLQPEAGVSEHAVVFDNPTAQRNSVEGCMWDQPKASGPLVYAKRATGENRVLEYCGHGNDIRGGPAAATVQVVKPDGY